MRQQKGAPARSDAKPSQDTETNRQVATKPGALASAAAAAEGRQGKGPADSAERARLTPTQLDQLASASKVASAKTPPARPPLSDTASVKPLAAPESAASKPSLGSAAAKPPTRPTPALNQPAKPTPPLAPPSTANTQAWLKEAIQSPPAGAATATTHTQKSTAPVVAAAPRIPSIRVILAGLVAVCALVLGGLLFRIGLFTSQSPTSTTPTLPPAATVKIAVVFSGSTPEGSTTVEAAAAMLPVTDSMSGTPVVAADLVTATIEAQAAQVVSETATVVVEATSTIPAATDSLTLTSTPSATTAASETPQPSTTPTAQPSATPLPTHTATALPTATLLPTSTPTAVAPTTVATSTRIPTQVPAEKPNEPIAYIVRDGDSCLLIARRYGISVARLVAYNDLDARCFIRTGKTVLIPPGEARPTATPEPTKTPAPTATPVTGTPYKVQPGDTCLDIAQRFKITVAELAEANQLDRATCFMNAGRTLIIPADVTATPQPTVAVIEIATGPTLVSPANGVALQANVAEVQLQWRFDGSLAYDEYFVVQIQPSGAGQSLIFQTKSRSMGVPRDALPASNQTLTWQVQVRRVVAGADGNSALTYENSRPPSAAWSFRWP